MKKFLIATITATLAFACLTVSALNFPVQKTGSCVAGAGAVTNESESVELLDKVIFTKLVLAPTGGVTVTLSRITTVTYDRLTNATVCTNIVGTVSVPSNAATVAFVPGTGTNVWLFPGEILTWSNAGTNTGFGIVERAKILLTP